MKVNRWVIVQKRATSFRFVNQKASSHSFRVVKLNIKEKIQLKNAVEKLSELLFFNFGSKNLN